MDAAQPLPALDLEHLPGVATRETHGSRVYLTGDRAYKVRKAVRFPFLDQTTPQQRQALAIAELTLNRVLAPGRYLGVRTLAGTQGLEVAVEMLRFREEDTLAARLANGRAGAADLAAIGARLAAFHADLPPEPVTDASGRMLARLDRVVEGGWSICTDPAERDRWWRAGRSLQAAVRRLAPRLDARAAEGRWREGHGDLRADHVVIDDLGIAVVDRLEFDRDLRLDDAGGDLAFLLADLEVRGFRDAALAVEQAYRGAGGDPGDRALLALWSGYRALVSWYVHGLRGAQLGRAPDPSRAEALLALAERCTWRTRPAIVVVCGAPATGKSTLAAELAARSGWPVFSSDVVRKAGRAFARVGAEGHAERYSHDEDLRVYHDLGVLAESSLREEGGVIVDATMGRRALRSTFARALGPGASPFFVELHAPAAVAQARAARRLHDRATYSDATPQIAARLRRARVPLDEVAPDRHLILRSDRLTDALADAVVGGLEAEAGVGAWPVDDGVSDEPHVLASHLLDLTRA